MTTGVVDPALDASPGSGEEGSTWLLSGVTTPSNSSCPVGNKGRAGTPTSVQGEEVTPAELSEATLVVGRAGRLAD
jgi:hypothetical protein